MALAAFGLRVLFMTRHALLVIGFLAFCFSVAGQQKLDTSSGLLLYNPRIFNTGDSSALLRGLPMLAFLDGKSFPISTGLGRMGTTPLHLFWDAPSSVASVHKARNVSQHQADAKDFEADGKNVSAQVMSAASDPLVYGGEVGVFYGHSTGKFGGDESGGYIQAGIGTDKFQLNVGVSGSESDLHVPRGRR